MNKRYVQIDGLKGFAVIGVIFYHYILAFAAFGFVGWNCGINPEDLKSHYLEYFPYSIISNTSFIYISITIISLLPSLYFFSNRKVDWIKKEASIRYFRFLPSIFLCVMISYLINKMGLFYNQELFSITNFNWNKSFYIGDMSFLNAIKSSFCSALLTGDATFNSVLWVMQVVFIGSYLSYFVIVFFGDFAKRYFIYFALFLLCFYLPIYMLFLTGIIAGDIICHTKENQFKKYTPYFVIFGFVFANLPSVYFPYKFLSYFFYSISALLFILASFNSPYLKKILSSNILTYCGKNSFSFILIHFPVMMSISAYTFIKLLPKTNYSFALIFTFLTAIVINYIAASIFSKLVKKPTNFICKKIYSFIQYK